MRPVILYIAISLDGFIAKEDGSVAWLEEIPNPDKTDHGYHAFLETIDTTLMGNTTYRQLIGWDIPFPYQQQTNYVFSRSATSAEPYAEYVNADPAAFVRDLKASRGKDIWLIGGGALTRELMRHGLVDEMRIFIMPIILGKGIPLFDASLSEETWRLHRTEQFSTGAVELCYRRRN